MKQESGVNDGQRGQQHGKDRGISRNGAVDLDFQETRRLLSKFKDDDRVRHVLMECSDAALDAALERVQQQLRDVETVSITAYIGEAEPLNHLHGLVSLLIECFGQLADPPSSNAVNAS